MKARVRRLARDRVLSAVAFFLVCTPSASAQEDCEDWARLLVGRGSIERLTACIEAGVDVQARDHLGRTVLHRAARWSDHAEAILALIEAGADVNARARDGGTPLHEALESGRSLLVLEALVEAGAEVDARDDRGNTPLHRFRWSSDGAVGRRLLELGADPLARNDLGEIAHPTHCENWNTVRFAAMATPEEAAACVAAGRDVNGRDERGDTPLRHAIAGNALRLAGYLLEVGADPDIANHQGTSPLHGAVEYGTAPVRLLLEAGADVNARDGTGATPLHAAEGRADVIGLLLEAGADGGSVDDWGRTPLHAAADTDSSTIARLVEAGADPTVRNLRGRTALHDASESGYTTGRVAALIASGAEVNAPEAAGHTPLHMAWVGGRSPVVDLLLALGADSTARNDRGQLPNPASCENWNTVGFMRAASAPGVAACVELGRDLNARNGAGDSPLHLAASQRDESFAAILLEAGADPDRRNLQGLAPLHLAAIRADTATAKLLIASGADPDARDNGGATPLHRAARHEHQAVATILLRAGADPDIRDSRGWTAWQWAAELGSGHGPTIAALLEAGADPQVRDRDGSPPLHTAAETGDPQLVSRLLELGADPNEPGWRGRTALHAAAWGPSAVVLQLLDAGADADARDRDGWSPLHVAARADDLATLSALMDAGAEVDARNGDGMTPLHRAVWGKVPANVAALLASGADANARTAGGDTPLHLVVGRMDARTVHPPRADGSASTFDQDTAIAATLVRAGADPTLRNSAGQTPVGLAQGHYYSAMAAVLVGLGAAPEEAVAAGGPLGAPVCNWSISVLAVAPVESIQECIDAGANVTAPNRVLHAVAAELGRNHAFASALVTTFLQAGADPNARDATGAAPLHEATWSWLRRPDELRGRQQLVAALLESGADPNARDDKADTPLHHLARIGFDDAPTATLLLAAGGDPNARNQEGETPLRLALEQQHHRIVDGLLVHGADAGRLDDPGRSDDPDIAPDPAGADEPPGFATAAACEDWPSPSFFLVASAEIVQRCIEEGADVMFALPHDPVSWDPNSTLPYSGGATPLHVAAGWTRDPEVVDVLVRAGADVNGLDPKHYTPLHRAARDNADPAVLTALLEAGANPNAWTAGTRHAYLARGVTPLHEAAVNHNPAVAARLLEAGAAPNAHGAGGATPLHVAAAENPNPAVVAALLDAGADVNARRAGGRTPLHEAAAKGSAAVVDALLRAGADLDAWGREDPQGRRFVVALTFKIGNIWGGYEEPLRLAGTRTPLHEAVAANADPAVTLALIQAGADVHASADLDRLFESAATPLHWAAAANANPAIIELLAAAGADLNAIAGSGRTPLHAAAMQNPVVFPALLRLGADPTALDRDGKTPMDHAATNPWLEVLEAVAQWKEER